MSVRLWWLCGVFLIAGCSGGSTPAGPSPVTPPAPTTATVSGHVTAVNGGQALGGVSVGLGATMLMTDGAGAFSSSLPFGSVRVTLTGAGILPRSVTAAVTSSRDLPLDAIALGSGFDPAFYRQFVRNTLDAPDRLEPLRRWTRAPNVYIQTSALVDVRQIDLVESLAREMVPVWTAGRFSVAAVERGTETRQGAAGWVTVLFSADTEHCGTANVGQEGGTVTLFPKTVGCSCDGYATRPGTIRHELGHAMGFWHTDNASDLMFGASAACDRQPSARERYHAAIAYSRPVGNVEPDSDPTSSILSLPLKVVP